MVPVLNRKAVFAAIALLVVGLLIGYVLGIQVAKGNSRNYSPAPSQQKGSLKTSPLFTRQNATVTGKVTKVDGNKITVVDDKNQSDIFVLSKNIAIVTAIAPGKVATPSTNIKDIQLNQSALIALQIVDGEYQVISIAYTNYPPASPSARNTIKP